MVKKKHIGSDFDDFLEEEGLKKIKGWKIEGVKNLSSEDLHVFYPHFLNETWKKRNGRLSHRQCINLGKKLDEGWIISENNREYIYIIYSTEYQILSLIEIIERKNKMRKGQYTLDEKCCIKEKLKNGL